MPRDEKRRQKSLQRKAGKRKRHARALTHTSPARVHTVDPTAATWALHECLVSRDWHVAGTLVQVIVARRSPAGQVAAAVVLVDLGCLGVKNAFAQMIPSALAYEQGLRAQIMRSQPMVRGDLNLAAKIIREGMAYARRWGFIPHGDFAQAAPLFDGADPDACDARIPLGRDGRPFFVSGPQDNPRKIVAQLTKTAGPGNFDYVVGFPA